MKVQEKKFIASYGDTIMWYNAFNSQKCLRNNPGESVKKLKSKMNGHIISSQLHFYIYVFLFNIWCLLKICNQLSHIRDSVSFNDSRWSDITSLAIDIYHTIYTSIPLFFPFSKFSEEKIKMMGNLKFSKNDECVFAFFSVYILLIFIFIIFQRLMLIQKEEINAWVKFIKLFFLLNLFWLIFRDYALMVIIKLGMPSCLFLMNIVWNIISKKVVTDIWWAFLIKFLLTLSTPIISINSYSWQWSNTKDSLKYFPYFRINMIALKENEFEKLWIQNQQTIFLQIILICILLLQRTNGSLFFLPSWFRTKVYENMARDIRRMSQTEVERTWNFCTNTLWQSELIYSDNCGGMQNGDQTKVIIETKWGFIYHQKWFNKYIVIFSNCHHWGCVIPKDGWDD